jgi:hypothetical protein
MKPLAPTAFGTLTSYEYEAGLNGSQMASK